MKRVVTMKDVAEHAKVSKSTVGRVLNGSGYADADTCRAVLKAAEELGYKPNTYARSLALAKIPKKILALINDLPYEVQDGIESELKDRFETVGPHIVSEIVRYSSVYANDKWEVDEEKLSALLSDVDGLIYQGRREFFAIPGVMQNIAQRNIKVVSLASGDISKNYVNVDAECVGQIAAQYLAVCGVRCPVMISGRKRSTIHEIFYSGFTGAFPDKSVKIGIGYTDDNLDIAYKETKRMFEENPNIDGIFVSSAVSVAVSDAVEDLGLSGKVVIVGNGISSACAARLKDGKISALIYPSQNIQIEKAVELLLQLMDNDQSVSEKSILVKPEMILPGNCKYYI